MHSYIYTLYTVNLYVPFVLSNKNVHVYIYIYIYIYIHVFNLLFKDFSKQPVKLVINHVDL